MKKSILTTFSAVFLIIIVVYLLLFTVLSDGLSAMFHNFGRNFYSLWIFVLVAALLALLFTLFNYLENLQIQQNFRKDVQRLEDNQKPQDPELQQLYAKMLEMSTELQELSVQKSADKAEIVETERKRISRELHDSVSQELFAATMILSSVTASSNLTEEQIMIQANLVLKILHEAQNEMRALLLHLRPVELDGQSLVTGLNSLTEELRAKISANINVKLGSVSATPNIEDNLFRMAQEILSNTLRHAQAENIEVSLRENYGNIILKIADDGVGFDPKDKKSASYGLANLRERALLLGGNVKVISAPNRGTIVEIRIPNIEQN